MGPERPTYGLTKNASTLLVQQIAKDTAPEDMQIVSFHPGGVLTEAARKQGFDENSGFRLDDGKYCSLNYSSHGNIRLLCCCCQFTVPESYDGLQMYCCRGPSGSLCRLGSHQRGAISSWTIRVGQLGYGRGQEWSHREADPGG